MPPWFWVATKIRVSCGWGGSNFDVAQTFLSAGLRDILVPCFILTQEATGKSPESRNAGLESLRYVITGNALSGWMEPRISFGSRIRLIQLNGQIQTAVKAKRDCGIADLGSARVSQAHGVATDSSNLPARAGAPRNGNKVAAMRPRPRLRLERGQLVRAFRSTRGQAARAPSSHITDIRRAGKTSRWPAGRSGRCQ